MAARLPPYKVRTGFAMPIYQVAAATDQPLSSLLLGSLLSRDLALLRDHIKPVKLHLGTVLQEANLPIERLWFPCSGMVSLMVPLNDGHSIQTVAVGREGAVGMFPTVEGSSSSRAVVQISGWAACISATNFQAALLQSQGIREIVLRYAGSLLSQLHQAVACNALHPLEGRFARWLLETHDHSNEDSLQFTQEDVAGLLGVRRTTVTVMARAFQGSGLIQYRRGHISIRDRAKLEQHACDCYRIMRRVVGSRPSAIGDVSVG
jgi:CRP-like cAMP-binding protein